MVDDITSRIAAVGPRLRDLRTRSGQTLAEVAAATGISTSTVSRLESGGRKPNLELLLPLADHYRVTLDELLLAPGQARGRVPAKPVVRGGHTIVPLTRRRGGLQAYKHIIPAGEVLPEPEPRTHEGYEWLYVLSGRLRVVLGDEDFVAQAGEAIEFDTRVPHWSDRADTGPVELLSIFGPQGERMHLRARARRSASSPRP